MPKLITVLCCERVVFDVDGPASVINIFQRMNIQRTGAPLPDRATSPTLWSIFTLWECEPAALDVTYTQRVSVIAPDGTTFYEVDAAFAQTVPGDPQIKIRTLVPGLPIWSEGKVEVAVTLDGAPELLGSFTYEVRYVPVAPNPAQTLGDDARQQ